MRWEKKGLIYLPDGRFDWNKSHAQVPVVDPQEEKWRIYYATRNITGQSITSYIDVEAANPQKIVYVHNKPILNVGRLGTFDEDGIMPSSIINVEGKKYLYYIGWSQRKNVPYQNSIGLAISEDGGLTFNKYSEGPIIGINDVDPFFTGTIFVLKEKDFFRAYYLSCTEWKIVNNKPESVYVIKYAESFDGIHWERPNKIIIPFKNDVEGGIASASVLQLDNKYVMWYGYRNFFDFRNNIENSYRIGYAESEDGIAWVRKDDLSGITLSLEGWDKEMISYPYVIKHLDLFYLFYNGNGFGKSGFGYAISNNG